MAGLATASIPARGPALPEIRRLLREGKIAEAHSLNHDAVSGIPDSMRCYEPLADLLFRFQHTGATEKPTTSSLSTAEGYVSPEFVGDAPVEYRSELDLRSAVATVSYVLAGIRYTRRYLSSAVDQVVAIRPRV